MPFYNPSYQSGTEVVTSPMATPGNDENGPTTTDAGLTNH